jgi:hypothetical protein
MKKIIVTTQAELDALPATFDEYTQIIIKGGTPDNRIIINVNRNNSSVVALYNSSVVAWDNSSVVAYNNSNVEAWENSNVVAQDNSSVVARDNSSVVARDNSSVEAWRNSSVVARDNSSVVAWNNSSVVAWGNSSVEAWDNVGIHLHSNNSNVVLFDSSVCWVLEKGKVQQKSKNATIIIPKLSIDNNDEWFENEAVENTDNNVVLFKRVSADFKTQEGTPNETVWTVGETITHNNWNPTNSECGAGKFHACSRPHFCDEFRSNKDDKYVAIKINVKDLHAWTGKDVQFTHKIAFRTGKVLYECDKIGKQV